MRSLGVRSLDAICEETLCGHAAQIDVNALPEGVAVIDVGLRLRCLRCRLKSVSTRRFEYHASGTPNSPKAHEHPDFVRPMTAQSGENSRASEGI